LRKPHQIPKIKLQARAIVNDCYKYIMDLTTNGVVITDAIKSVQTNKEKLTTMSISQKDDNSEESEEPDYDEDKDQLEESQEEETGEKQLLMQPFDLKLEITA
jgi:Ran GTPase-activating protein (RanGAP) involved in mRNA processing and transport